MMGRACIGLQNNLVRSKVWCLCDMLGDITNKHISFPRHLGNLRDEALLQSILLSEFSFMKTRRFAFTRKFFQVKARVDLNPTQIESRHSTICKKAISIATFESTSSLTSEDNERHGHDTLQPTQIQSSNGNTSDLDERERLRRMRISKAIKGNTPWNKGRKHSAETLQRIREKTKLAMQDPKVKMRLLNKGHSQSKETKMKIRIGVKLRWQKHHEKLMQQESCYFQWQNLIAESSRRGYAGEEEHEWESYMVLDEKIEKEWLEYIERRNNKPPPKPRKRAPKSPEQRRKISDAISAKWSDPEYRDRVFSAMAKYHRKPVGMERKLKRRPDGDKQTRERSRVKGKSCVKFDIAGKSSVSQPPQTRSSNSNSSLYKDPLSNAKLEMVKNIRTQRVAAETKTSEAIKQARLLIAEAEKAAKALEVPAMTNPLVLASLLETRKLIAEAMQSIASIDSKQISSDQIRRRPTYASVKPVVHFEQQLDARAGAGLNGTVNLRQLNGLRNHKDHNFGGRTLQTTSKGCISPSLDSNSLINHSDSTHQDSQWGQNEDIKSNVFKLSYMEKEAHLNSNAIARKWINGRLIEASED